MVGFGNSNSGDTTGGKKFAIGIMQDEKGKTSTSSTKDIEKAIAGGAIPGAAGLSFEYSLIESANKTRQMFIQSHELISGNGLMVSPGPGQPWQYTENFTYDPIRSSLGCFWGQNKNVMKFLRGGSNNDSNQLLGKSYGKEIDEVVGVEGIQPGIKIIPGVKYKMKDTYQKAGVTHFKLSPAKIDSNSPFKAKVLNLGYTQYMCIYFGLRNYSPPFQPLVPFNVMFDAKQKLEGFSFSGIGGEPGLLTFIKKSASGYKDLVVEPKTNESDLLESGIVVDALGNFNFGKGGAGSQAITAIESKTYSDHAIYYPSALSKETLPFFGSENIQGNLFADVEPVYNYYLPEWEYATPKLPEVYIGDIYTAAHEKMNGNLSPKYEFKSFAHKFINCRIDEKEYANHPSVKKSHNIVLNPTPELLKVVEDIKEQFPMYNEISFNPSPTGKLSLSLKESGLTNEFLRTFLTYVGGDYSDKSAESGFEKLAKILALSSVEPVILEGKDNSILSRLKDPASLNMFPDDEELVLTEDETTCFDLLGWLQWYLTELENPPATGDMKLYDENQYNKYSSFHGSSKWKASFGGQNKNSFDKALTLVKFLTRFSTHIDKLKRVMENLLSWDRSHFASQDTLYYRIEKKLTKTGEVLQNFYILPPDPQPDSGIREEIKFIDTQVKYGELYTYEIHAVCAVVGTDYQYTIAPDPTEQSEFLSEANQIVNTAGEVVYGNKLAFTQIGSKEGYLYDVGDSTITSNDVLQDGTNKYVLPIKVNLKPTVKILEIPFYKEEDVKICDFPPMMPLVNMYPLSGKENKILITLENQTGDRELEPISVEDEDNVYFIEERFAQKRNIVYPGGRYVYPTLRFKSDDSCSNYEVYRIEGRVPTKYSDFAGKLHASLNQLQSVPQAGLEDTIKTNTKYYYMFRTRDMHGNVSNPSPVYEFEMVVAGQEVFYPVIRVYDMGELKSRAAEQQKTSFSTEKKALKKTVQIMPADQQIMLNEEKSGITGETANIPEQDPVLGVTDETVWNGKRFKFRFTSRHTGKAIDINVDFNTVNDKPPEAIETCLGDEPE